MHFYSHIPCGMWLNAVDSIQPVYNFYSHIPCGMWRHPWCPHSAENWFLLTHPVWDVTVARKADFEHLLNFYSHIPCGMWLICTISCTPAMTFLLTHPVWDVTKLFSESCFFHPISTHTSRVGCDYTNRYLVAGCMNFYSHIPCGMWLPARLQPSLERNFYSHIPCGMWLDKIIQDIE